VKFLNYQVRKRILVTGKVHISDFLKKFQFLYLYYLKFTSLFHFRRRGIRRKSFSRFFNETGELGVKNQTNLLENCVKLSRKM